MAVVAGSRSTHDVLASVTAALGGEPRPGQVAMVDAVARALGTGTAVAVAAPTGTGKSFGYLVPVILAGTRTVVVTATKALQDQLDRKDLPFLADHGGRAFTWALLKGRSNYVCRAKATELHLELESGHGTAATEALLDWLERTEVGDQAELDVDTPVHWPALSITSEECPGARKCAYGAECFYERARARAADADVIVTNTAMYGAHLASGGAVLPHHDVVVIDEAHAAEDALRGAMDTALDSVRIVAFANRVASVDEVLAERLRAAAAILDSALVGSEPGWLPDGPCALATIDAALLDVGTSVSAAVTAVRRAVPAGDDGESDARTRAERLLAVATSTEADVARVRAWRDGDVSWIEADHGRTRLHLAPLDVAPLLEATAWGEGVTAVLTSATLDRTTPARLGLDRCDFVEVESPFDFRAHALLYVPELPVPGAPAFRARADDEIARVVGAAGGRSLVLFTSLRAMRDSAAAVAERVDVPILVQGDGSKAALFARFVEDEATCLFATMSFWQGIDPAGRTCSAVIVDKIPFPRPDDPVVAAQRAAAGADAFSAVDLPRAGSLLAQGVGRLIRSRDDRGVVAVLDARLAERSYRKALLDRLPPMPRTRSFADVERFLATALTGPPDDDVRI